MLKKIPSTTTTNMIMNEAVGGGFKSNRGRTSKRIAIAAVVTALVLVIAGTAPQNRRLGTNERVVMVKEAATQPPQEESGGYWEGDIRASSGDIQRAYGPNVQTTGVKLSKDRETKKVGADGLTAYTNWFWPNGRMVYQYDASLASQSRSDMDWAIQHIRTHVPGVSFVVRTTESAYVNIIGGCCCWSYIGRTGGRQDLQLGVYCGRGAAVHELLHAFGFWHEQSRPDRDNFVNIHLGNVQSGMENNFQKRGANEINSLGSRYDYGSIMHYNSHAFSANGHATITAKTPGVTLGQRNGLSNHDILQMRAAYPSGAVCWNSGLLTEPKEPMKEGEAVGEDEGMVHPKQSPDMAQVLAVGSDAGWHHIPGKLMNVAIAGTGAIYGVNSAHHIFYKQSPTQGGWGQIDGLLTEISVSVDGTLVTGVNGGHDIFYRNGVSASNLAGTSWTHQHGKLKDVTTGTRIYGVNSADFIFRKQQSDANWCHLPGLLRQISAHGTNVVGVNMHDDIFKYLGHGTWEHIDGKAIWASMGSDGEFWVVNRNHDIFRRTGSSWTHIAGKLKQIDVADAGNIIGVNAADDIFAWY